MSVGPSKYSAVSRTHVSLCALTTASQATQSQDLVISCAEPPVLVRCVVRCVPPDAARSMHGGTGSTNCLVHGRCFRDPQDVESWQGLHTGRTDEGYARCGMSKCAKASVSLLQRADSGTFARYLHGVFDRLKECMSSLVKARGVDLMFPLSLNKGHCKVYREAGLGGGCCSHGEKKSIGRKEASRGFMAPS